MNFTDTLLRWYDENKRSLPWRGESDPYKVWVSEVILQQTRVAQGTDYYYRFIETFPTVEALAQAREEEVLKVWQGLGYYSRARNIHYAAQQVVKQHHGLFPNTYAAIRQLKGIGDYTAAAIASIAFNLPHAAVDGNVLRFISRYSGNFNNIALNKTRKEITNFCNQQMPQTEAGNFNQALIEMGATLCTPKSPDCQRCPFQTSCYAFLHQQVETLPIKEVKLQIRQRHFHYIIFIANEQTLIQQRTDNDIWKSLYEFPLYETKDGELDLEEVLRSCGTRPLTTPQTLWRTSHQLTHQSLDVHFIVVSTRTLPQPTKNQSIVSLEQLDTYAVSRVTEQAIGKLLLR